MLRWKRRVQGYTPEGSREFQVRIWGARGEGVKAGSESSDTASSIGTLREAVSMWWKKVIHWATMRSVGKIKYFSFFFFSCSFLSFCVLLDYEMVSFHSGPSHTNVSGNWWSGNWYLHHGLQILGNMSPWVSQPVSRYTLLSGWRTRGWPVEEAKVKGWVASLGKKMAIS